MGNLDMGFSRISRQEWGKHYWEEMAKHLKHSGMFLSDPCSEDKVEPL